MKLTFAFKTEARGFFSWAIRFVTKSQDKISHVEVLFPDGWSFSSREPKGTSWALIDYSKDKWIFCDIDITQEQLERLIRLAAEYDKKPYDFLGIVRLYVTKSVENERQFCSEISGRLAHAIGLAKNVDPNLTSPQRLFDVIAADPRVTIRRSYVAVA